MLDFSIRTYVKYNWQYIPKNHNSSNNPINSVISFTNYRDQLLDQSHSFVVSGQLSINALYCFNSYWPTPIPIQLTVFMVASKEIIKLQWRYLKDHLFAVSVKLHTHIIILFVNIWNAKIVPFGDVVNAKYKLNLHLLYFRILFW